ncbi:MAG TPA: hypothetical protein VMV76_03005 [Dehalococcoidia bacterium]|nr:hypothetical protein [Dehalococcoidia bacterium]
MRIVDSGIDTLVIGFSIQSYVGVNNFEALTEAKSKAGEKQFDKKGCGVEWFGTEFNMAARGAMGYEWVMRNADVTVCIARETRGGSIIPEVYVTFSSQNLWTNGLDGAVMMFKRWLSTWAVISDNKISRADLCLDIAMPFPVIDIKSEIVSRARKKRRVNELVKIEHHVECRRDTGYRFGAGELVGRLYDKTNEVKISQKEWMREVWKAEGWDGETSVVRYEFQCRRNFLKEMSVNSFEELKERLADIWRYCTHDWLRVCDQGANTNQSRWKSKDYWTLIQQSFSMFGQAYGVLRMKSKQVRYDHLLKQIRGCCVSGVAALGSGLGTASGMFKLREDLRAMLQSEDFIADVAKRQGSVANMEKPATHLVDAALRMGAKIVSVDID